MNEVIEFIDQNEVIEITEQSRDALSVHGRQFDSAAPNNDEVFAWDSGLNQWTPKAIDELAGGFVNSDGDTMTGGLVIDGAADEIQLRVQGTAGQSADIVVFEASDGTDHFTMDSAGLIVFGQVATFSSGLDGVLGAVTPAAVTATTMNATGGGALTGTWTDLGVVTTIDINGGTIDDTVIGGSSAVAGTFNALAVTGTSQFTGNLGIGIAPGVPQITVDNATGGTIRMTRSTAGSSSQQLGLIEFGAQTVDQSLVQIQGKQAGATDAGKLVILCEPTGGSMTEVAELQAGATKLTGTLETTGNITVTDGTISLTASDLGDGAAGHSVSIGQNNNGTNTGAGFLVLAEKDGTSQRIWADDTGVLRINTADPTNANDTAGTVVGDQSSWWEEKKNIVRLNDRTTILLGVLDVQMWSYQFSDDSRRPTKVMTGYVIHERGAWWAMNDAEDQTPSLDVANVVGHITVAVQEVHEIVMDHHIITMDSRRRIDDLERELQGLNERLAA